MPRTIPSVTVSRLVAYLRVLTDLERQGVAYVTSDELGAAAGVSAHQVRKDLVHAEAPGTRGRGYTVAPLRLELSSLLGLTRPWNAAIVGMGRLGQAIADYPYYGNSSFNIRAGFDVDPSKIGQRLTGQLVYGMDELPQRTKELELDIALLTVPVSAAQSAAENLAAAGIRGILNFTPTVLAVPPEVRVEPVDFVAGLKRLAFYLQSDAAPVGP